MLLGPRNREFHCYDGSGSGGYAVAVRGPPNGIRRLLRLEGLLLPDRCCYYGTCQNFNTGNCF